jgi:DNA-binding MarR family transcriptional regulator
MKEIECIQKVESIVRKLLEDTGIMEVVKIEPEFQDDSLSEQKILPDFVIKVKTKDNKQYSLFFEVKPIGQPRYVRMAVNQLQALVSRKEEVYGVFGAPYLSEESIRICRENDIGFIDIAGNCLLKFNNIYINIQGKPNPYPTTRPLKSLFTPKATRALRVLLCNPRKEWTVVDLAEEASISLGQASNLKKKLLDYEFIEEVRTQKGLRFRILNPEDLLKKWAENYSYRKNTVRNYYSFDEVKNTEKKLITYCETNKIRYAFTLTSGASLVAPSLRYKRVFAYIDDSLENVAQALGWKEVPSGQNVSLLEPYDEGVFYGLQDINGTKVVSDIQLYLDLKNYRERGEEAAEFLLERRLRPKW